MPWLAAAFSGASAVLLVLFSMLLATDAPRPRVAESNDSLVVHQDAPRIHVRPPPPAFTFEEPERPPAVVTASAASPSMPEPVITHARAITAAPPPPTAVATPAVAPFAGNPLVLSQSELYALTLEVSGDPSWATWATRVIVCESGGRVNAVSPGGHYGLAQVALGHPYDFARMVSEPRYAVEAMYAIYQRAGPSSWSCK